MTKQRLLKTVFATFRRRATRSTFREDLKADSEVIMPPCEGDIALQMNELAL